MTEEEKEPRGITNVDAAFNTVFQDIASLGLKISVVAEQVTKLSRFNKVDELGGAAEESRVRIELLKAMADSTQAVNSLTRSNARVGAELQPDNTIFREQKYRRRLESHSNLRYIKILADSPQTKIQECPCGNHQGVRFLEHIDSLNIDGKTVEVDHFVVVEELCPKDWWIKQTRIAFEGGYLSKFTKSTPLGLYLEGYKLK